MDLSRTIFAGHNMENTSFWMEKSRRTLLFRAALIFSFVILLFPWLDFRSGINNMQFDRLMQSFTNSSETIDPKEEPPKLVLARLLEGDGRTKLETKGFACDVRQRFTICVSNQPVRVDITSGNITVHVPSNDESRQTEITIVQPYSGHREKTIIQYITPVRIITGNQPNPPVCEFNHSDPATIFSSAFTGNVFHEFHDLIIPLFLTTKHLKSRVHLILEDYNSKFVAKYKNVTSRLSSHEIMKVRRDGTERSVHCFPGVVIGLRFNGHMTLDPKDVPGETSMQDFRQVLRASFSLRFPYTPQIRKPPRLMLLSRDRTRMLLNENEIVSMMKEIGFEVVVSRPQELSNLNKYANVVNSCSVLVGVHGAGLVNELFLPIGAVVLQIELLSLEWVSATYFGKPAAEMGLHYIRYKIEPEESSLLELYGRNHSVITDPSSIFANGYAAAREVYLIQQNVRINVVKFRETLLQAFKLVTNTVQ